VFEAPSAVILIGAVYVLVVRPAIFTVTVMASVSVVVVPEAALRLSQPAVSLTVQLKVPFPVSVMFNV